MNIAVTGTIGAGKSRVTKTLSYITNGKVIDSDKLCHQLMLPGQKGYQAFVEKYGKQYLTEDGLVNRESLRIALVDVPDIKKQIEEILHPLVKEIILAEIDRSDANCTFCFFEIPLLFEVGWQDYFDTTIAVYVDEQTGIKRLVQRDGVDEKYAKKLIALQMSSTEKANCASLIIDNSGSYTKTIYNILQTTQHLRSCSAN